MSNDKAAMSLQQKVSVTLLAVMAVLALASDVILKRVISPAFDELELNAAKTNLVRADRAINAELNDLGQLAVDWGPWDDAYRYVQGQYPAFERVNISVTVLNELHLDLMLFYNSSGEIHWGRLIVDEKAVDTASSGVFDTGLPLETQLLKHTTPLSASRGLLQTALGPMMIASMPITRTDHSGPIAGTLVIGRFLDVAMLAQLQQRTEVNFKWNTIGGPSINHSAEVQTLLDAAPGTISYETASDAVHTFSLRRDLNGEPIMLLHANTPRKISALGNQTMSGALLLLAIATLVVAIVIWLLLRNMIIKPLEQLTTHISEIHASGDLSKSMAMQRSDEIGTLAAKFDDMTADLDDARKLLQEQSFKAGKADTAAEVLHNIRNAMTPVINGISRLGKVFKITNSLKVDQAMAELNNPDCDAKRRVKLLQYIDSAFDHIEASHTEGRKDLQTVSTQAQQVKAILSDQERHAHAPPVIEPLQLEEMLDEAVLVIPKDKLPKIELKVRGAVSQYQVQGHRIGLAQVLGNVILNAYESIQRSQAGNGCICLSASNETVNDTRMVRLIIKDSGSGFSPDQKTKIFQRGYSSKKKGQLSGLGLHWCANALSAMGGRIQAESTGNGQGAEFHVLLPAA